MIDEIWSLLPYGSFGFGYGFISGEFSKWCGVVVWYCEIYGDRLVKFCFGNIGVVLDVVGINCFVI